LRLRIEFETGSLPCADEERNKLVSLADIVVEHSGYFLDYHVQNSARTTQVLIRIGEEEHSYISTKLTISVSYSHKHFTEYYIAHQHIGLCIKAHHSFVL
jgi:hypothetical protein